MNLVPSYARALLGVALLVATLGLAGTLYVDVSLGLALAIGEDSFIRSFGVDSTLAMRGEMLGSYAVTQRFVPPQTVFQLPEDLPVMLRLANGWVFSSAPGSGDFALRLDGVVSSFFLSIDRVDFVRFPWRVDAQRVEIDSPVFSFFLPEFLEKLGHSHLLPQVRTALAKGSFPVTLWLDTSPLELDFSEVLCRAYYPLLLAENANFPLVRVQWTLNGQKSSFPFTWIPRKDGTLEVTLEATDVRGNWAKISREIFVEPYRPLFETSLVFDKARLGEKVLFVEGQPGNWQVYDRVFQGDSLSIAFEVPGSYPVVFTAPGTVRKYRVVVE
ncbi:MAG TPA: hypothetical protein P5560_01620 [Thermotogota bacterium]|nr:hypothetical protein [Thermotogota bacterium]HRW91626.1 hypothetical protein [Thermotogota bacterium]